MYKNKSYKPQLRIGLSRNNKPSTKSPIKITPTPGVKSRTLGISRKYKTSKCIENLLKSPILNNAITNSLPDDVKKSTRKPRNCETKTTRIYNKKENDSFERHKIPSECENEEVGKINASKNAENEDTSISYSPLENLGSTLNKKLDISKTAEVERLILENTTCERKILNSSLLKMRKCSRLSLKRSSTMELSEESDIDVKPFKNKAKLMRFQSNSSIASNTSECIVILDRLSDEILKTNNCDQNHKQIPNRKDTEFVDLSNTCQKKNDKTSLCNEIISLEQLFKFKNNHLSSLKRSVIYKNKHNLRDLTAVTDTWKNGCKLALKDLLIAVQNDSELNTTMSDLFVQLKIPEDILKYDAENDEII